MLISEYTQNPELQEALRCFVDMRRDIKKPLISRRAFMGIANKLKPYDDCTQIKMLDNAISNSWQSVYPISEKTGKPNPQNFEQREDIDFDERERQQLMRRVNGGSP